MGKTKGKKVGNDKAYIHPNSRKAKHLSHYQAHHDKVKKVQDIKLARLENKASKMMFFKERLNELFLEDEKLNKQQMLRVIDAYFSRFDSEMEQIALIQSIPKRHGRQNAARQDAIAMTLGQEKEEFEGAGIELPDVLHAAGFKALKSWNGKVKELPNLVLKKFKRTDFSSENTGE